jgi:hypothetical protein
VAVIKLENIAATASITLQLIKDYSMYDSEIISSNGTIFQSTDTDTTLSLRVYKGIEDITYKITDIKWSRFYFQGDELVEDFDWSADKDNKHKVNLHKDEIEGKSIIQAAGYSMIEGRRELVTTARITIIKISDVYVSDIEPEDPSDEMMWMDTNKTPPILKIWDEDLKAWISSGTDIPIVKNFIRNSNFWTEVNDYYEIVNDSNIETAIEVYQNKNWLSLKTINRRANNGGIAQTIQYPITKNSSHIFSFIAYKQTNNGYNGNNIHIKITEIDSKGQERDIINKQERLETSISTIEVPFKTTNKTEQLVVYLGTEQGSKMSSFYVTELSLYNSAVYYPWELCPEDVDKQMNTKLDNNRLSVFNTLTDNNNYKAIYESNNQYYIRQEYIVPAVATATALNTTNTNVTNNYNELLGKHNELLGKHNELLDKHNELSNKHNELSNKHNELVNNYDKLLNSHNTDINNLTGIINGLISRIETLENPNANGPETPTPTPEQ